MIGHYIILRLVLNYDLLKDRRIKDVTTIAFRLFMKKIYFKLPYVYSVIDYRRRQNNCPVPRFCS